MNDGSMIAIWQAQGILMERHDVSAELAMELLTENATRAGSSVEVEAQRMVSIP
jgi:AmiR/NasT family two-component response regulator